MTVERSGQFPTVAQKEKVGWFVMSFAFTTLVSKWK